MNFGEKIRECRLSQHLSQGELAELSGIHIVSISKYETNRTKPQFEQIKRIADALHVDPCIFCGFYDDA